MLVCVLLLIVTSLVDRTTFNGVITPLVRRTLCDENMLHMLFDYMLHILCVFVRSFLVVVVVAHLFVFLFRFLVDSGIWLFAEHTVQLHQVCLYFLLFIAQFSNLMIVYFWHFVHFHRSSKHSIISPSSHYQLLLFLMCAMPKSKIQNEHSHAHTHLKWSQ